MSEETGPRHSLESVRASERYGKAIWGYRIYYTGMIAALGLLVVSCATANAPSSALAITALVVGLVGMAYGSAKLRADYRRYMEDVKVDDFAELRLRRAKWQQALIRDAFMGRD
ncbi:hypothetical protein [Natronoglycomyces albus]|uniref:Uncharacterized protein n=1 Tax=Natronoglycomyces albus TaxID=2811108 RepID=A0A895XND5_9ACTN|nr:hypothetical protein [Natronoglycomyces albus]QSB03996.1 hypothetical protein JQS30_09180 [Natronoglycomyces albus]